LSEKLAKKAAERFNRGSQTKKVKTKTRDCQTVTVANLSTKTLST